MSVLPENDTPLVSSSIIDMPEPGLDELETGSVNYEQVHHKARHGMKLLMGRQVGVQIFTFLGGVIIARKLGPASFGLYGIANFLVLTLAHFSDFGLAPSFIQRKEELTDHDLHVGFTIQQALTTFVVVILAITAPWLARLYPHAPPETAWLVRALAFTLFLTSWRTMSALQLERTLKYDRLALVELIETVVYQTVAVVMALSGKGVWSFVAAILAQGLVGTILVYMASPWKIRFAYDSKIAREIFRFGIPFQFQALANRMGDWVIALYVGSRIGPGAVGLLMWASANGKKPLMLVDSVMRVAFPHFSRIQHDREEVYRTLTRYLVGLLTATALWFSLIAVAGPAVVQCVYSGKWSEGVIALTLYSVALSFDTISWVIGVSLNALGNPKFTTTIVVLRGVAYIAGSVPMVMLIGFNGVPLAMIIAQIISIPWIFKGLGPGSIRRVLGPSSWLFLPVVVTVIIGISIRQLPFGPILQSFILVPTVLGSFGTVTLLFGPDWLKREIRRRITTLLGRA